MDRGDRGRGPRPDFGRPFKRRRGGGSSGGFEGRRPHGYPGDGGGPRGPPGRPGSRQKFAPGPPIDREKVCPLLLRVFPRVGAHHQLEEFGQRGQEPKEEFQIYTWPDATLRELTELVKEVHESARRPSARLSFALVYPDKTGRNVMRQLGVVHSSRPGAEDAASLRALKFQTGDFMSVAVY